MTVWPVKSIALPAPGADELPPPPLPDDGYVISLGDEVTYDTNLYRLPSNFANLSTLVAPNASRSDQINSATAGLDGQWNAGRQEFGLSARADDNRFQHNGYLDNVSLSDNFVWNWQVGSVLTGQVGQDYSRSLAAFAETRVYGRDIVDAPDYYATGRWQLGPHWAVYGGVNEAKSTHSAVEAELQDSDIKSGHVGADYALGLDSVIGFEYQYSDGTYPQGFIVNDVPFNRNFKDDQERVFINYSLSDKTVIAASVGYLRRDYTDQAIGAFSGGVWRTSLQWQATEKTQIVAAAWHELHAYISNQSEFFVAQGGSISPVWLPTEKLQFSLSLSYQTQNYIASSQSALLLGTRDDKLRSEQLNFQYSPTRTINLKLSIRDEQRTSNQAQFAYDDQLVKAGFMVKF